MNTLLENLLIIFLKITLLSWIIWGIIGIIILMVLIYVFLDNRFEFSKFLTYAIPIIIISLCSKSILSNPELISYIPMLEEFRNINQFMFIILGIVLSLIGWRFVKEV